MKYFFLMMFFFDIAYAGVNDFPNVKLIKVIDGDTFIVDIKNVNPLLGQGIPVRIKGIDAAELKDKNKCAREMAEIARCKLKDLLSNVVIDVCNPKRDKYFRIAGNIYANGKNVADILLGLELVVSYNGEQKKKTDWCELLGKVNNNPNLASCK